MRKLTVLEMIALMNAPDDKFFAVFQELKLRYKNGSDAEVHVNIPDALQARWGFLEHLRNDTVLEKQSRLLRRLKSKVAVEIRHVLKGVWINPDQAVYGKFPTHVTGFFTNPDGLSHTDERSLMQAELHSELPFAILHQTPLVTLIATVSVFGDTRLYTTYVLTSMIEVIKTPEE